MSVRKIELAPGVRVSCVGMGGHYKAMEEGEYEHRTALVEPYLDSHARLIRRAIDVGVSYFDTTWRNEVEMFARSVAGAAVRDQVFVNGMVLGAFRAPKAQGISPEDYFNRWLDSRLGLVPGHRFDSFMINAIEEDYDERVCAKLVALLERRQAAGEINLIGISSHNHEIARHVLDKFPQLQLAMLPYSFHSHGRFDAAFSNYNGNVSFIAMKTLVWAEYGIPFCVLNLLPNFRKVLGFEPVDDIQTQALRFCLAHPLIKVAICSINSTQELQGLASAGATAPGKAIDMKALQKYEAAMQKDGGIHLFRAALETDNLRMNYFGAANLSRLLGLAMPPMPLNEPDSQERVQAFAANLKDLYP